MKPVQRMAPAGLRHRLRMLAAPFLLAALLLALGAMSLVWNLVAMLLHPLLPAMRAQAIGRVAISYIYRIFWTLALATDMLEIDAGCLDAFRQERGLILVANHPSMLDALVFVARLPRSACIMKAGLMRNIFLGSGARLARYICNDSPLALVKRAVAELRQGGQLVVFPEGTRSAGCRRLNRLRPGITLIARRAQAPIQCVIIETDSPYLGKGWPIWRLPPLPARFTLRPGERFQPEDDCQALLDRIECHFRRELDAAPPAAR